MKKKHYLLFLLALLFLLTDVVWAQTSATVSGVVIDENGETLPGVSVVEVGTTNGVLTDLNGHYTLKTTSAKPFCDVFQLNGVCFAHQARPPFSVLCLYFCVGLCCYFAGTYSRSGARQRVTPLPKRYSKRAAL